MRPRSRPVQAFGRAHCGPRRCYGHSPTSGGCCGCAILAAMLFVDSDQGDFPMLGLMQDQPLLISSLIEFAERHHGDAEIVSRRSKATSTATPGRDVARALAPGRQRARRRAAAVQRPRRHAGLERLPPPGAVLRRERLGPRAAHHQPAPAPRPDRLDRQPRRRPDPVLRPELPAAGAGGARALPDHQEVDRAVRRRQAAGRQRRPEPGELRGLDGRAVRPTTPGRASTRTPPRACATRPAPRATRRPRSTATAPRCCTPTPRRCPT